MRSFHFFVVFSVFCVGLAAFGQVGSESDAQGLIVGDIVTYKISGPTETNGRTVVRLVAPVASSPTSTARVYQPAAPTASGSSHLADRETMIRQNTATPLLPSHLRT